MIKLLSIIVIYLALALTLEFAVLSQFQVLPNDQFQRAAYWITQTMDGRCLLPLAGVLIGLLRGEIQGMLVALAAAMLFGFAQMPGHLGAAVVSFTFPAFLAGLMARRIRLYSFTARWFYIVLLLILERLVWWMIRKFFWPTLSLWEYMRMNLAWPALILTALFGSLLYKWMPSRLRLRLYTSETQ